MKENKNTENKKKKISLHIVLPLIFLIAIAIILITSVTKFSIWNRGIILDAPDEDALENLEDETEDYFVYYSPDEFSQLHSDYVDDDQLNIVIFGDESITDFSDGTGISQQIQSSYPDANIYSICFPNSQISPKEFPFDIEYPNDVLSLYWVSLCVAGDNYDFQTSFWDQIEIADDIATDSLALMQSIDFSTIDLCIFNYNGKEYLAGEEVESLDREDYSMYANAVYLSLEMLEEAYPHMQFLVASPTYCLIEENGQLLGSEITNSGFGFLPSYMIASKNASTQLGNSFMDNILGAPINKDTYTDYLEDDGLTLNEAGRTIIANRYIEFLKDAVD